MKKTNKKGFTLVEIMIVVVIIGLLATLAIPAFAKVRQSAQEKAVTNNLRQLAQAAEQYFLESGLTEVKTADLVGTESGKYIKTIQAVAGEAYPTDITAGFTTLATTTKPNGFTGNVVYTPGGKTKIEGSSSTTTAQ